MRRSLLFGCIVLIGLSAGLLGAKEHPAGAARKLILEKLTQYSCRLSAEEAEEAARQEFRLKGITVESFAKTAECMRILVKGLRAVVEQHQEPDAVYKSLQMEKHRISSGNWAYYLKKYQTPESISNLEKAIPDNEQTIIRSMAKAVAPLLETWLLEQKIIRDFDRRYPQKKDLPVEEKLRSWWEQELRKYPGIEGRDKTIILGILSRRSFFPDKEVEFWKRHFKSRLQ